MLKETCDIYYRVAANLLIDLYPKNCDERRHDCF